MSAGDWVTVVLLAACVIVVCLPPRWDPAIRLKERGDPRITARLKALNQAAAEQPLARYPYCIEGRLSCGSQTCGCLDTPHYRARWQSARATAIVKEADTACAGCGNAFSCMYPDCKDRS